MRVHRAAVAKVLIPPDGLQQVFPREHLIPVAGQREQELQLLSGQADLPSLHPGCICIQVHRQVSQRDRLAGRGWPAIHPAQHRAQPRHQFAGRERLDNVVISTRIQAHDAFKILPAGRDHDDGHIGLVADGAADLETVLAGEHHVENQQFEFFVQDTRFGRVTNLTVGLCGDLTFGRTVHSLIETLCRFGNVNFVLISPDELKTPQYVLDRINATESCSYTEVKDLVSVIGDLDVLYMTRVQKERFFNEDDYLRLRDTYILDEAKMAYAKKDMAVLHPLPRVNEIAVEVDDDPRAAYFEQVKNGMLMRMALESSVVGDELPGYEPLAAKEVEA